MIRVALAFLLFARSGLPAVTLSEIMFDPTGNEGTDEFIELYNEGTTSVNLDGWRVTDGADTDRIISVEQGLLAAPRQYILVLDPDYLDDGSTTYDGLIPEDALVVTLDNSTLGSRGLSNSSAETVTLLNASGSAVSQYEYSLGNISGYSDEKRVLSGPNDETNWNNSLTLLGTPGRVNSMTPPDHDLAVVQVQTDPAVVQPHSTFSLRTQIANLGARAAGCHVQIAEPLGGGDTLVLFDRWTIPSLATGDTLDLLSAVFSLADSSRRFRVSVDSLDDRPDNNERTIIVRPGGTRDGLVINEIMYSPASGRAEWVELLNASGSELDVAGWTFADGSHLEDSVGRLPLPSFVIAPDSFILLAADSTIYFDYVPVTARVFIYEDDFPTLNNAGDSLAIFDPTGMSVERVDFRANWGGAGGVSLERIAAASAANDPANWGSSVDSSGATPCRENSRAVDFLTGGDQMLTLTPNPFTPNGDNRDEEMIIQYELSYPSAILDVKIFDVQGRIVRTLADNKSVGTGGFERWDGTDNQGRRLPSGLYVIYAEAAAAGGSRIQKSKRVATLLRPS